MPSLNESTVEDAALSWFEELGYACTNGLLIAPGEPAAERESFGDVFLVGRLRAAISRINPTIPVEAQQDALRKVLHHDVVSFIGKNRQLHRMLRDGVEVEYKRADGGIAGVSAKLIGWV